MISAHCFTVRGPALHLSGGEMFSPSAVYLAGIASPLLNAGLMILTPQRPPLMSPSMASLPSDLHPAAPSATTSRHPVTHVLTRRPMCARMQCSFPERVESTTASY